MPRRRRKSDLDVYLDALLDLLLRVPVYVGPLLALGTYLGFRFVVPAAMRGVGSDAGRLLADLSGSVAWIPTGLVVVAWGFAEVWKLRDRHLLDSRTDIRSLKALSWQEFESLVGEAFRRSGYVVEETPPGADGGIDLILKRRGQQTLVQCKQWQKWRVGVKTVRELYGVVTARGAAGGIVVCCGTYTQEAKTFAERIPIELIDGRRLWHMIEAAKKPMSAPAVDLEKAPAADADEAPAGEEPVRRCPKCSAEMVLRTTKRGKHVGSSFYGCSRYPRCRGIVNLDSEQPKTSA